MSKSEEIKVLDNIDNPKLHLQVGLSLLEDKLAKLKERLTSGDIRDNSQGND